MSYTAHGETPAGDRVVNTASASYAVGTIPQAANSNADTIIVAERLDVALVRSASGAVPAAAGAIPLRLTNGGNGMEAFRLSASDGSATPPTGFAIDVDGDGRYDAGTDTMLADAVTPVLAAGATLDLLLLGDPAGFAAGQVTVAAQALTGVGTPGTAFAGQGDGGGDAVVGPSGAQAQAIVPVGGDDQPALSKTQSVLAPDGTARAIRGAVITYTLSARFAGPVSGARIDDPLPAGTAYVPGSLSLDGQSLSDAADADAGQAGASSVGVALGDIAAAGVRTLQFQVLIQ